MSQCVQFDCSHPDQIHLPLNPYPDISGRGVIIGFVGTTYFVFVLLLGNFLIAYDPEECPFESLSGGDTQTSGHGSPRAAWWKPNPVDVMCLRWLRRFVTCVLPMGSVITWWEPRRPLIADAFDSCINSLCDIQLMTGIGILISGFSTLSCGLPAYHWQIVVCLAWFACVTHLSGLIALRRYLHRRPWQKFIRYVLSLVLLGILLVAVVPTAFFDWRADVYSRRFSLAKESTPAQCFFDFSRQWDYYHSRRAAACEEESRYTCSPWSFGESSALESMMLSSGLLILSFLSLSVKLFESLTDIAYNRLRIPFRKKASGFMAKVYSLTHAATRYIRRKAFPHEVTLAQRTVSPTEILLRAMWITISLHLDILNSRVFEIYWLLILLLWGTLRLASSLATDDETIPKIEREWTFGQILPVVLLVAPVVTSIESFSPGVISYRPRVPALQRNWPRETQATTQHVIVDRMHASVAGTLPTSVCLSVLPSSRRSPSPQPGNGPVPEVDVVMPGISTPTPAPMWPQEVNYQEAPWLGPCVAGIWMTIVYFTIYSSFWIFYYGSDMAFRPKTTLIQLWFATALFYYAISSYPAVILSVVFVGVYMDNWNGPPTRQGWSIKSKCVFWIFATLICFPRIPVRQFWIGEPLYARSWIVLSVVYGLALVHSWVWNARQRRIAL